MVVVSADAEETVLEISVLQALVIDVDFIVEENIRDCSLHRHLRSLNDNVKIVHFRHGTRKAVTMRQVTVVVQMED